MDELQIDDKKYVSSKRAAELTGYAKDYVGQLCREGKIEARLVGRSWYILESAIQDHRFGQQKDKVSSAPGNEPHRAFESDVPRYSTEPVNLIPEVIEEDTTAREPQTNIEEIREDMPQNEEAEEAKGVEAAPLEVFEQEPATIYQAETVPLQRFKSTERTFSEAATNVRPLMPPKTDFKIVKGLLWLGFLSSALLAALGTGYFDAIVPNLGPISILAGIASYFKP